MDVPGRYQRNHGAPSRELPDCVLVFSNDQIHTLVGPAATMWSLLDRPIAADALIDALGARFGGQREVIEADAIAALHELEEAGVIARC